MSPELLPYLPLCALVGLFGGAGLYASDRKQDDLAALCWIVVLVGLIAIMRET